MISFWLSLEGQKQNSLGFPGGSHGKESACNAGDSGSIPRLAKISWRRKWPLTPVFLPGEFHEQRSLVGYTPWGCKELVMTEWLTLSVSFRHSKKNREKHSRLKDTPLLTSSPHMQKGGRYPVGILPWLEAGDARDQCEGMRGSMQLGLVLRPLWLQNYLLSDSPQLWLLEI